MKLDESILSFRSGKRYRNAINGGGVNLIDSSLNYDFGRELGDKGHNFRHHKAQINMTHPKVDLRYDYTSKNTQVYRGPGYFSRPPSDLPYHEYKPLYLTDNELNVYGTKAIADAYPTKPQVDLIVSLAEILREGIPSNLFSAVAGYRGNGRRDLIKNVSSDYLNLVFGISPIVREVDKLIKTIERSEKILRQLQRDSGRVVRRARTVEDSTKVVFSKFDILDTPALIVHNGTFGNHDQGSTRATLTQTLHRNVWFRGAFQYQLPDSAMSGNPGELKLDSSGKPVEGSFESTDIIANIYGLRATPKALWNLIPFSWLVDWFVNIGDLLENANAFQSYGLVMPYAYVMAESRLITTWSHNFKQPPVGGYKPLGHLAVNVVNTTKQRRRATPYGFGIKSADLNPYQLSILGALGGTLASSKR